MVPGENIKSVGDVDFTANDGLISKLANIANNKLHSALVPDFFRETEMDRRNREAEEKKKERQENDATKSETASKGFFNRSVDYSFYMWLLLLLKSNEDKTGGIGNIIQMEMDYCALRKGYAREFRLTRAYTQINVQAKASVASLFPSFGAFGLFGTVESSKHIGY
jgi:hypothetical protein